MATTKKITDLNKTTTVGNSDLLVLAQSGQQEAQSATVGALVDKVATQISDGALIEHLAGLSKQKQLLAKALTDKGVEGITEKSTLDEMAAEIKDLDVVGAQDKVVCEFCSQFDTTTSKLSARIATNQAVALHGHNAIISVSTSGVFGIYKLAVDGTLKQSASYDCSDFVPTPSSSNYGRFGYSKNEEHLAWYDAKLKKLIVFHMDWETNTLTRTLAYTTTTSNLGTSGSNEATSTSNYYLLGIAPASDGSKVCILSSNKSYICSTIIDVATQTEVTNLGNTANAVNNSARICWGFWHWDIGTGLIQGGTSYYPLFEMTLDLSGDIPFMSFGGYRISNLGNYISGCYGMPYFLWDKGVMLQLATTEYAYSKLYNKSGVYGTLWLRDIETGRVLDSAEIEIDRLLFTKNSSTGNTNLHVGCSSSKSSSYSPIVVKKDGKFLVGFGTYMRFELDEENKKLIPYKHNGAKDANDRYVCFPAAPSASGNTYMPPNYIYCDENPDLVFTAFGDQENYASWGETNNVIWYYEEPCVLGIFLNRNGKRRLMYDYFSYTQYQAGAYAEKDEVEHLNLSESEG